MSIVAKRSLISAIADLLLTKLQTKQSWLLLWPTACNDHGRLRVCLRVCLSLAAFLHYCTDPDVTWRNGRGCPIVVQYWADLQSAHGCRCYDNAKCQRLLVLALCLVWYFEGEKTNNWKGHRADLNSKSSSNSSAVYPTLKCLAFFIQELFVENRLLTLGTYTFILKSIIFNWNCLNCSAVSSV